MFLQKQDEKYLLKFHTGSGGIVPGVNNRDDVKKILSPVIKFSTMLVRPVATNKRAFYLMNTTQMGAQLYELQVEYIFNKVLYKRILHCVKVYIIPSDMGLTGFGLMGQKIFFVLDLTLQ